MEQSEVYGVLFAQGLTRPVSVSTQLGSSGIVFTLKALLEVKKTLGTMNTERTRVSDIRSQISSFVWWDRNSTLSSLNHNRRRHLLTVGPHKASANIKQVGP